MTYRVGIDIGGTFTDFALLKGSEVILHKNLSTPEDRSEGVMQGLAKLAELEGLSPADFLAQCDAIVHGTTVADNTLIEMNGALTGLITTEGFRDELEYRRGFKEDIWDVRLAPPKQIVPRRRRVTVPERMLHDGTVHKALDEAAVREACRKLRVQGVESVAISLLFSFVNPDHEKRVKAIVAQEMQNAHISHRPRSAAARAGIRPHLHHSRQCLCRPARHLLSRTAGHAAQGGRLHQPADGHAGLGRGDDQGIYRRRADPRARFGPGRRRHRLGPHRPREGPPGPALRRHGRHLLRHVGGDQGRPRPPKRAGTCTTAISSACRW